MIPPIIADTGGLLRRPRPHPNRPAELSRIRTNPDFGAAVIVPGLVLAEVDPATRYEYELPLPTDIVRALELGAGFEDLDLGLVDGMVAGVAERRRVYRVLTTDRRDFAAVRIGPRLTRAFDLWR